VKQSYFRTPRTLGDSTFWHGGDAFEIPEPRTKLSPRVVFLLILAVGLWGGVVLAINLA
jgi:hypothetical protein